MLFLMENHNNKIIFKIYTLASGVDKRDDKKDGKKRAVCQLHRFYVVIHLIFQFIETYERFYEILACQNLAHKTNLHKVKILDYTL